MLNDTSVSRPAPSSTEGNFRGGEPHERTRFADGVSRVTGTTPDESGAGAGVARWHPPRASLAHTPDEQAKPSPVGASSVGDGARRARGTRRGASPPRGPTPPESAGHLDGTPPRSAPGRAIALARRDGGRHPPPARRSQAERARDQRTPRIAVRRLMPA